MIQNTLFAEYISQREGKRIIEDERGFIIYQIQGDECYLAEGFVSEEARGSSAFSDLIRHVTAAAKAEGCKVMTANIHLADAGASRTLRAVLKRGFKVCSANKDILMIMREV